MLSTELVKKIEGLKKKRNAVILSHTYQLPEIQDIADFIGDSLNLSLEVEKSDAKVIVFCGVRFMAETAKLVSPEKTILMPEPTAGCPLADMITAQDIRNLRLKYPDHKIVCYVNSTADVKAQSDICCTSSNAVRVVDSFPKDQGVIFIPDANLGNYVKRKLSKDNMVLWPGHCYVHSLITADEVNEIKNEHKNAIVMAHPECITEVLDLADYILSTSGMISQVEKVDAKEFIIVTEHGILHPLKKRYPDKTFYPIKKALCENMKKTTIDLIPLSLENMEYKIELPESVIVGARESVNKMLKLK